MKTNTEATQNEATTAAVAEQDAPSAPEQATSTKKASAKKGTPKAKKAAKAAKPATKKADKAAPKKQATAKAKAPSKKAAKAAAKPEKAQPREGSKKQIVLDLMRRKDGATMAEIAKATGWQNHSIRGFVSGALMKKMELPVVSFKNETGERCYRIEK
jgi:hypothetical protein